MGWPQAEVTMALVGVRGPACRTMQASGLPAATTIAVTTCEQAPSQSPCAQQSDASMSTDRLP